LAKARILKVVNYREEDMGSLKLLEEILKRENKEFTAWVREQTVEYVRKHGNGNPAFKIEQWVDQSKLKALPATSELIEHPEKLRELSKGDVESLHHFTGKELQKRFSKWRATSKED